uniref:exopolyphosphatase n=1 Tax=Erigeron canadensis TaxID=72917 RepID=UPI001CB8CC87|nr:exopolyphosphatase [Erigeron canadensis]
MTTTDPLLPFPTTTTTNHHHLFAAIDLGTNSFKLRIIQADPSTGRFLTLKRLKEPIILISSNNPSTISQSAQTRAIQSLTKFQHILTSFNVPGSHLRLVATSAVRESTNQSEFVSFVRQTLGWEVDVVSGYEEARLSYIGMLQFHPYYDYNVLNIDIGGGSTEFVVGSNGVVKFGVSLKLGHVSLTQTFVRNNDVDGMRMFVRNTVMESGLVEKVLNEKIDVVVGSSGSIRMIEKAIFMGYGYDLVNEVGLLDGYRRDWKFSKDELNGLVEKLLCEEGEGEGEGEVDKRKGFFKTRSGFIVAAVVLLEEIFGLLGIKEMEVSGYALGEGVIAEKLAEVFDGFDLNANARWRSVLRLASRFNNKKRMTSAASCASIAQGIFKGLRNWSEVDGQRNEVVLLDDKDLEYLEAACLLHNIGLITGKKGYHKQSYHIIKNGEHLHGYNNEEVRLIALLARYHRKKFPKLDHDSLSEFTDKMKRKFRVLCVIIRLSAVLKQYQSSSIQDVELSHSHEGFKLVVRDASLSADNVESVQQVAIDVELRKELEHFEKVLEQKLSVVVLSSPSGS